MFLTRMKMSTENRNVMRALVAPNIIHGVIESAFPGERKRRLWRLDHLRDGVYLLLLSEDRPDLSHAAEQFGASAWETVPYEPLLDRIERGSRWHFRLVANPTVSRSQGENKRGKIYAHSTVYYQRQWLLKKAEKNGFALEEDSIDVTKSQWFRFRKKEEGQMLSLLQVSYEGVLTVTDPEVFKKALTEGIGREKAFGMGLLTIIGA